VAVLEALAADPVSWRYGYELGQEVGLKAGSLYPILIRLADRELLETRWEAPPPGRPARHLYRLTSAGLDLATTLAASAQEPSGEPARARQPGAARPRPARPGIAPPGPAAAPAGTRHRPRQPGPARPGLAPPGPAGPRPQPDGA
jgi:hypothetical protein